MTRELILIVSSRRGREEISREFVIYLLKPILDAMLAYISLLTRKRSKG